MSAAYRLLDLGAAPVVRTQAFYHGLARAMTPETPDTILLCRPSDTCFCVGHHQDPDAELDTAFCRAQGYPVLRREIGGGAVLLGPGQVFYQVIVHASRAPLRVDAIYATFLAAPVKTLRELGLDARLEGSNEIEVGGRRIAGTGGGRIVDAMVLTGNLLVDFPYELMERAWRVRTPAFSALAGRALRESVTTLRRELGQAPDVAALSDHLARAFNLTLDRPVEGGALSGEEAARIAETEDALLSPVPEERALRGDRSLKIARDVFVRETADGPRLERGRRPERVPRGQRVHIEGGAPGASHPKEAR